MILGLDAYALRKVGTSQGRATWASCGDLYQARVAKEKACCFCSSRFTDLPHGGGGAEQQGDPPLTDQKHPHGQAELLHKETRKPKATEKKVNQTVFRMVCSFEKVRIACYFIAARKRPYRGKVLAGKGDVNPRRSYALSLGGVGFYAKAPCVPNHGSCPTISSRFQPKRQGSRPLTWAVRRLAGYPKIQSFKVFKLFQAHRLQ